MWPLSGLLQYAAFQIDFSIDRYIQHDTYESHIIASVHFYWWRHNDIVLAETSATFIVFDTQYSFNKTSLNVDVCNVETVWNSRTVDGISLLDVLIRVPPVV